MIAQRPGMRTRRRSIRSRLRPALIYVPVAIFLFVTLAPLYYIALSAFTPTNQLFTIPLNYLPSHLSGANFQAVANALPLVHQFANSTVLSAASAAISVVLSVLAAYAFARLRFPGSNVLFLLLYLSGLLPAVVTIIPLFQTFEQFALLDTLHGLIILYVSLLLPASVWLMASFIRQIPIELEEAARVDGASFAGVFWHIVIPLLRPALATLFLLNFIAAWNEFFLPLIFSRTDATTTLTIGITQASINPQDQTVSWGSLAAMSLIVIAPMFALVIAFQKQIMTGLMAGALKG